MNNDNKAKKIDIASFTLNSAKDEDNHVIIAVGTTGIILQAPSLYDLRPAIDEYLSEIEVAVAKPKGRIENY